VKIQDLLLLISIPMALASACNSASKQAASPTTAASTTTASTSTSTADSSTGSSTSSSSTSSTSTDSTVSTADPDSWLEGYYTGYNGTDKFSIYLPSFRQMTIDDATIAKIEQETVTLSEATIAELVADQKAKNASFDEAKLREMLSKTRTVFKLTPLKPGTTKLRTASAGKGPTGTKWSQGQAVTLVVADYTAAQVILGKTRYSTEGEGKKVSCLSCHEGGANGAPPHALGSIMSLPDASAAKWITTGKVGSRVASIEHAWEFASTAERDGVVAYLRTLQAGDLETLTKLEFENQILNMPAPPASTTTTSTQTTTGG
jgi:hypothetical protein